MKTFKIKAGAARGARYGWASPREAEASIRRFFAAILAAASFRPLAALAATILVRRAASACSIDRKSVV